MPWRLSQRKGRWCVVKEGESSPVPGGCHDSRADAIKHQRALYANESRMASMETLNDKVNKLWYYVGMDGEEWQTNTVSEALTAAASFAPPRSVFETPEPDRPTPMTYEDDGRVYGHPALWGSCHRGFMGGAFEQCVSPPRSNTDYAQFHLGHIITQEGERVAIGKITFDTDHAPLTANVQAASRHYDNTGSVGAYVRATNGRLGPWFSGVLKPDLAPEALVALRANPLSGDWRQLNGNLEMVAALAVPVPGFPIPQLALSAAIDGGAVEALILPGYCECEDGMEYTPAQIRQKKMLTDRLTASLATESEYEDGFTAAVFTAEQRQRLAKSGAAMPDGSFPIRNCSDLMNARRAVGRAAPGRRAAVRAHISKRARALGCSTEGM